MDNHHLHNSDDHKIIEENHAADLRIYQLLCEHCSLNNIIPILIVISHNQYEEDKDNHCFNQNYQVSFSAIPPHMEILLTSQDLRDHSYHITIKLPSCK